MSVVALFNFAQLRQRPRWIVPLALASLLSGAMPAVHQAVFGPDLIAQAAVKQLETDMLHRPLDPREQEMVRSNFEKRPLLASGLILVVVTALLILLSAVVLNLTSLVVGADVTPGQVLAVASVAACAETVLRVLAFAIAATVVAPERVVTFEWMGVGRSNLAFLEGFGATALWTTFVSSIDAVTIVSIAVASIGLKVMDRTLGTLRAVVAASVWPALGIALRVLVAWLTGLPLR